MLKGEVVPLQLVRGLMRLGVLERRHEGWHYHDGVITTRDLDDLIARYGAP